MGANRGWLVGMLALIALPTLAQAPLALPMAAKAPASAAAGPRAASPAPRPATAVRTGLVVQHSGQLLGLVTDAAGRPQANVVVQVRSDGLHGPVLQRLTTGQGIFSLSGLAPGTYYVEVGKGARVAERRRVEVHASERALLLVNLPQLLQSVQLGPPAGTPNDQAFDWALRQATIWRPILRLDDAGTLPADAADGGDTPMQGYVALIAGSGASAFDSPGLATAFGLDTQLWSGVLASLTGDVGSNGTIGAADADTRVQASFRSTDSSDPDHFTVAVRQVALPGLPSLPSLRVVSLNYSSALGLGDNLHLQYGAMFNAVTMTDTVSSFDPYLRAIYRLGDKGQLEYRVASAVPPLHFDADPGDMPDPTSQITLDQNRARLEQARHQELRYSESLTPNDTVTAAVFDDQFEGAAINGAFSLGGSAPGISTAALAGGNLLPDLWNNMFIANGGDYGGWGYRVVLDHHLSDHWRADFGFSDGAALVADSAQWNGSLAASLAAVRAHAFTAKMSGLTPLTHTQIVCSYRALSRTTVTGLDLYDDDAAQSDSYANVSLRQPLPHRLGGGNSRIEALIEIHNLLAQGYVPMMGSDGHTLYLVQSARSLRGGLTFHF